MANNEEYDDLKGLPCPEGHSWHKVCVAGINSNGEPDLWFGVFRFPDEEVDSDAWARTVEIAASETGFEFMLCANQDDPMGACCQLAEWDSKSVFVCSEKGVEAECESLKKYKSLVL